MNILKSIFIVGLLLTLEIIISLGIDFLIEDYIPIDYLHHYLGLTNLLPRIFAYALIFKIFKANFGWANGKEKLKSIKIYRIIYLLIIVIGLGLFDRPFFDFSKIINFIKGVEIEPYKAREFNVSNFYIGIEALIIAPLFEELLFRKYIFIQLLKKYSSNLSIVISSTLFSLIHLPSYRNLIPTFFFGIISCLIYKKTRNVFYIIIFHFFCNLIWLILTFYGEAFYKWSYGLEFNLIYWVLFVTGIIITLFGLKRITTANSGS